MIKTKECKIIYKQCEECGKVKFYKKIKNRKGKNGKLYVGKICHSCVHNKRKKQLSHKEICDICGKEYPCNYQERNLTHHFCSEECKNIYEQKQHEQYYTTATCNYCKKEYEVLTSTYNQSKEGLHFCSKECSTSYIKETRGSKETFICENCGKELIKNSDTYNSKAKHHFCSRKCAGEFNSKQSKQNTVTLTCSQCGQEFTRRKSIFKEAEHYFCSQKCRTEYTREHNKKYCTKCNKPIPKSRKYDLCPECLIEERHNEKYIKFNCAYCGKHFNKGLNAHHLNSKDWDKDNMYNVDNGVPLCNECHQDYHMLYGYGNNTEEQFLEWYNEYLDEE